VRGNAPVGNQDMGTAAADSTVTATAGSCLTGL
jgi:hypothetical protein